MVGIFIRKYKIGPGIVLSIASLLVTISCNSANLEEELNKIDFSEAPVKEMDFGDIQKEWAFVPLQVPDSVYLGKIGAIRFVDKYIVLHDRDLAKALYVFDQEGNYINRLGNEGEGQGEYLSLYAFSIKEDHAFVYDRNQQNIIKYTFPDFRFVSSESINLYLTEMIGTDEGFLGISDDFEEEGYYVGLVFFDEHFQLVGSMKKRPGKIEATENVNFSTDGTNRRFYTEPLTEKIFRIDKNALEAQYIIDFGSYGIPEKATSFSESESFYEFLSGGHYHFASHNFNIADSIVSVNFYNRNISSKLLGLYDFKKDEGVIIQSFGEVTDYVLSPVNVQAGYNIALLYPDEYSRETLRQLGMKQESLGNIDISRPIIYKYRYVDIPF